MVRVCVCTHARMQSRSRPSAQSDNWMTPARAESHLRRLVALEQAEASWVSQAVSRTRDSPRGPVLGKGTPDTGTRFPELGILAASCLARML